MSDDDTTTTESTTTETVGEPEPAAPRRARRGTPPAASVTGTDGPDAAETADAHGAAPAVPKRRRATKKSALEPTGPAGTGMPAAPAAGPDAVAIEEATTPVPRRRRAAKKVAAPDPAPLVEAPAADALAVGVALAGELAHEVGDAPVVVAPAADEVQPVTAEPAAVAPRRAPVTSAEPIRMKPLTPEALLAAVERGRRRAAVAAESTTADAPAPNPAPAGPVGGAAPSAVAATATGAMNTDLPDGTATPPGRAPDPASTTTPDPRFRRRGEPGWGEDRAGGDDAPTASTGAGGDQLDAAPARRPTLAPLFVDADEQPRGARRRTRSRGGDQAGTDNGAAEQSSTADGMRDGPDQLLDRLVAHAPGDVDETDDTGTEDTGADDTGADDTGARRKRRRRGGRGRRRVADDEADEGTDAATDARETDTPGPESRDLEPRDTEPRDTDTDDGGAVQRAPGGGADEEDQTSEGGTRRRRRRRGGEGADGTEDQAADDAVETTVRVREPRRRRTREGHEDEVTSSRGSTRLEAKKIRRKEGRDANKRRPPILSEAEFLARRESVGRTMLVRESAGRTQIAVLEDDILVEHYIAENASNSERSMIGDVYLGRVQNVLPAMEAAFIDIGHGRNGVLYAGEVNWDGTGLDGKPKRIELALKSGQSVLVQVTKDPIGHKGARLTAQISLAGRYLVYVPNGSMSGISRKLPDTERARLKKILKELIPSDAGVIVRTAAEGATEAELTGDVERLQGQWAAISTKAKGSAPNLLQGEPDLAVKVVRDIFNSDFTRLVVTGDEVRDEVLSYVGSVAPTLVDRVETWDGDEDLFAAHRVDEQLAKALERKVFLPSGGSLVIDRTEAMTVVDVNTGRFTGSGGNLEETVTENNLEAAEELVRQLRLRDIGGIIVVDFIDMVFEANRDLVIRRLVECLGRDRTKHQVAEVSSLGLVQMTRKRIGRGLLEVFGHPCEACKGRGVVVDLDGVHEHDAPERRAVPGRVPNPGNTGRLHSAKVAAGVLPLTDVAADTTSGGRGVAGGPDVDVTTDEVDRGVDLAVDRAADGAVEPEPELVVAGHPS